MNNCFDYWTSFTLSAVSPFSVSQHETTLKFFMTYRLAYLHTAQATEIITSAALMTSVPSHLTHHAAFLSCPSPTLFWEAEKMKSAKTYIRINLLQADRLSNHLEIHATLHSEGHNSLKYFYSQDSPFLVHMFVLHVSAVTLKNSSTPSGQQHWGHASAKIITALHPAPLPSPRQIAGPCPPSPPSSASSSSHPLASPGTCFPYQCFHSSTARRCSIMCSNREAEAYAGCSSL